MSGGVVITDCVKAGTCKAGTPTPGASPSEKTPGGLLQFPVFDKSGATPTQAPKSGPITSAPEHQVTTAPGGSPQDNKPGGLLQYPVFDKSGATPTLAPTATPAPRTGTTGLPTTPVPTLAPKPTLAPAGKSGTSSGSLSPKSTLAPTATPAPKMRSTNQTMPTETRKQVIREHMKPRPAQMRTCKVVAGRRTVCN
jgi:hypothetical protein